ncbi:helix-turn-helix transcriptional regulator [Klebsiella pneumoniae]|nr:helix-turn-helix transcriptional regulator [Klebsiella pneumoniae]
MGYSAIDQIAQFGLSSLKVIYYSEQLFSSRMNHYEKGRHVPDIDTLRRMAAELNVPLNYFFCDDQTTAELALLISRMTDEERRNLIEALKSSPGGKHADKK